MYEIKRVFIAGIVSCVVRNVNEAPPPVGLGCPCAAELSWCNYGRGDCPRVNTCKGSLTPCDCNSCPTTGISCKGCDGPSPSPSPDPPPSPSPSPKCNSTSDCQSDEVCCTCNCDFGDADLGDFGCNCDKDGKMMPDSQQPHCCGGESGLEAWCAKAGTPSFNNPKCNSTSTVFGIPTPVSDFVRYGQHHRCVKEKIGCKAGHCDNTSPDAHTRGACGGDVLSCHLKPGASPNYKSVCIAEKTATTCNALNLTCIWESDPTCYLKPGASPNYKSVCTAEKTETACNALNLTCIWESDPTQLYEE